MHCRSKRVLTVLCFVLSMSVACQETPVTPTPPPDTTPNDTTAPDVPDDMWTDTAPDVVDPPDEGPVDEGPIDVTPEDVPPVDVGPLPCNPPLSVEPMDPMVATYSTLIFVPSGGTGNAKQLVLLGRPTYSRPGFFSVHGGSPTEVSRE